jgi:Protein of unknown function (DUF3606)
MTFREGKTCGMNRERIDILEKYELRDWAISLDLPQDLIREAVLTVGDRADHVVSYLEKRACAA